jgi:hypothetical protein
MKKHGNLSRLDDFQAYRPTAAAWRAAAAREQVAEDVLSRQQWIVSWVCSLVAAGIMIETLFFKFSASEESVYIFSKLGTEPWMRWVQGIWELLASIGLLVPRLRWAGGILTTGAMGAAILSHLTWLGFAIRGDHGLLFGMAVTTFVCGFTVLCLHRHAIPFVDSLPRW